MMSSVVDGSGSYFRLKDWRYGLCLVLETALHPAELWRIERWHLHHSDPDAALVMNQFTSQGICEARNGVLSSPISRLKRNASISERRTDLDDGSALAYRS